MMSLTQPALYSLKTTKRIPIAISVNDTVNLFITDTFSRSDMTHNQPVYSGHLYTADMLTSRSVIYRSQCIYNVTQPGNEFGLAVIAFSPTATEVVMSCLSPMIMSTGRIIIYIQQGSI